MDVTIPYMIPAVTGTDSRGRSPYASKRYMAATPLVTACGGDSSTEGGDF